MSRWLFSPRTDLLAFGGVALASAAVAFGGRALGITGETPLWAWLCFVVGIDVAHVWSTLFRVYLDAEELRRHPLRYAAAPLASYAAGVSLYAVSGQLFWRLLAYAAAWHFVRQQVGWMALYGRRAGDGPRQRSFDALATYAVTLGPLLWWHARLPRPFWWFVENDFTALPHEVGLAALVSHAVIAGAWLLHALRGPRRHWGKVVLLLSTWLVWFGGIVLARSDFEFTVLNVALHGIPYLVLLFRYAQGRARDGGYGAGRALLKLGGAGFVAFLVALAFVEELGWDTAVWHDHPEVFGAWGLSLPDGLLALVVPLLALPQLTHYVLDGFVWRTREDPKLVPRLGWAAAPDV